MVKFIFSELGLESDSDVYIYVEHELKVVRKEWRTAQHSRCGPDAIIRYLFIGLAYQGKDIAYKFNIFDSSLRDLGS
jgi:hypothetical protein